MYAIEVVSDQLDFERDIDAEQSGIEIDKSKWKGMKIFNSSKGMQNSGGKSDENIWSCTIQH